MHQINQANLTNPMTPPENDDRRSAFSNLPDELLTMMKALGGTYQRGIQAEVTAQIMRNLSARALDPIVLGQLMRAGMLAAEGFMRGRQYDARAAIAPAGQIIQTVRAIQAASAAVRAWAATPPRRTRFNWFRRGVFWGGQKMALWGKIGQLESTLEAAADAFDYAGSQIRQQYSLLNLFVPGATPAGHAAETAPATQCPEAPFPVPPAGFRTVRDQVIAVRAFVGEFAGYLAATAGESAQLIDANRTSDGTGVNPVTVQAQGRSLVKLVLAGLVTCRELEYVLDRPLAAPPPRGQRQPKPPRRRTRERDGVDQHTTGAEEANGGWPPPAPAA